MEETPSETDFLRLSRTSLGKAVFALRVFRKGERVLRFRGKLYTNEDQPRGLNATRNHYLQIGKNLFLGPSRGFDNYINHACFPNAGVRIEAREVWLIALRRIRAGEEITFDYSTTMIHDDWTMICRCGHRSCRKIIREFRLLPQEIRERYLRGGEVPDYVRSIYGGKVFPTE